ncbi:hypothetical protein RUM43_011109 [Polyplax serrata]|uniref:Uncharacterized protein n=1 Tax=Polyplax serrata TaxID=468196 RepID=A0AAN8P4M5_POLSC
MDSRIGLDYIVENPEYITKLAGVTRHMSAREWSVPEISTHLSSGPFCPVSSRWSKHPGGPPKSKFHVKKNMEMDLKQTNRLDFWRSNSVISHFGFVRFMLARKEYPSEHPSRDNPRSFVDENFDRNKSENLATEVCRCNR